jgi:hypothetical protein
MNSKTTIAAAFLAAGLVFSAGGALAQTQPATGTDPTQANDKSETKANDNSDKSEHSTGRTIVPETKGQKQPQGWTGPIETGVGGAPASSPQGQTPPGMQAAPEGSSKTTVEPDKKE